MRFAFFKPTTYIGFILFSMLCISCSTPNEVIPKPIISIAAQVPQSGEECISGFIYGANAGLYTLAIYAKVDDGWYNIPDRSNPLTTIATDGFWICKIKNDIPGIVSELNIYLIPNGFDPPILQGEIIIPIKMNLVAASRKSMIW